MEEDAEQTRALIGQAVNVLYETLQDKIEWNRPNTDILYRLISQFRTIRKLVTADNQHQQIVKELLKADFIGVVLTNAPVILRFVEATDEAIRAIISISRTSDDDLALQVIKRLFENGAVIFVVLAMKAHMLTSQSIRVQGLELLTRILEYVKKEGNGAEVGTVTYTGTGTGTGTGTRAYPKQEDSCVRDAVHQMLLHGAAAILVRLLAFSMESASETAMRRAISCMQFLVLETPPQMTLKLATYDNFSAVRSLCKAFDGTKTRMAQLDAASLLTGFLSASVAVAELITALGAWDQLSVILATNAETINVPKEWLVGSLQSIRKLGEDPTTRGNVVRKAPAAGDGSTLTMPLGDSSVQVSVEGSFENILTSMLEDVYESHNSRRVNKQPLTTFEKGQTLNTQYSAAMQMHNSSSMPNLHKTDAKTKKRPESSGGRRRQGRGGGGPRLYGEGGGQRLSSAGAAYSRPRSAHEAKAAAAQFLATAGSRPGSSQIRRGLAEESSECVPGFHGSGMNSNFARRLKKSPLGLPIDPDKIKRLKQQNGGKLPEHIPHALGGPDIGNRPGPDHGSTVKKKSTAGPPSPANLRGHERSPFQGHLKQAPSFKLLPTPTKAGTAGEPAGAVSGGDAGGDAGGTETRGSTYKAIKKAGSDVSRKQQHACFVAEKLFVSEGDQQRAWEIRRRKGDTDTNQKPPPEKEEPQHKANERMPDSAVGKLTFAEKLQVMIMQMEGI